ncbi:MAG TPA: histidine phosphatase family protein [Cyclobacteriaceae bacterium]|nr:histidine phosphatase family protein [Cyclobacteriaceae bacterium]HMV10744.1 histidine phosphatase family protein [Cyclobacteriaceae bacterium]HMV90829.1 histidine phosphatase family protein [Cyclobacteriaceae bacterium]HMX01674.1 histidine phosphatase family protein [Cyclobacteriaceae bacterium]HMX51351.1 histidine phosphatase family protein [Cyclobacteriaceae bacterium]
MERFLYLMRHAQSADKQPGQTDKDRELTVQGLRDSIKVGAWLYNEKINPDAIISSTAVRAKSTAGLLLDTLKLMPEIIRLNDEFYDASVRTFLQEITQLEDTLNRVLCVGHNPTVSYLAEYLTKAEIGELPPGGLVIIQFDILLWQKIGEGTGKFINVITPETL